MINPEGKSEQVVRFVLSKGSPRREERITLQYPLDKDFGSHPEHLELFLKHRTSSERTREISMTTAHDGKTTTIPKEELLEVASWPTEDIQEYTKLTAIRARAMLTQVTIFEAAPSSLN